VLAGVHVWAQSELIIIGTPVCGSSTTIGRERGEG
jgi:hypothetical protein